MTVLVLAPLRIEARALRPGLGDGAPCAAPAWGRGARAAQAR